MATQFRRMLRHVRNLEKFLKHGLIEYAVLFMELEITFIGKGRGFNTGRSADMLLCEHHNAMFLQSLPPSVCVNDCNAFMQGFVRLTSTTFNRLTPNDPYMGSTALLTSKRCILYIYSTSIGTEYFKHALYSPFFSLQNAVCFIMLTCLVPVLFTFYIQDVLK